MNRAGTWLVMAFTAAKILAPATVVAGPPYATDDPEPVPSMHWEIYIASAHEIRRDGVAGSAPFADVNLGAGPNMHLHALLPLAYSRPSGGPTAYGLGDVELGAKIRLVQEGELAPMVGTYPAIDFPTGNDAKALGAGHWRVFLPVWVQKGFGRWNAYGGPGYWIGRGARHQNSWFLGGVLQRRLTDRLAMGVELFDTTAAEVGGRNNLRFNVGVTLDFGAIDHLLISTGRSLVGDSLLQAYIAWQLTI